MDKKLPEVVCPTCNLTQIWRGQKACIHRGCFWSKWFRDRLAEAFSLHRKAS